MVAEAWCGGVKREALRVGSLVVRRHELSKEVEWIRGLVDVNNGSFDQARSRFTETHGTRKSSFLLGTVVEKILALWGKMAVSFRRWTVQMIQAIRIEGTCHFSFWRDFSKV